MKIHKRKIITFLILLSSIVFAFTFLKPDRSADRQAILKTIENYNKGWESRNVELVLTDYADSTDWTNAFGDRVRTREQLRALLTEIFSLDFVMAGKQNYTENDFNFLSNDVALLRSRNLRKGQKYSSGEPMKDRDINHLRVYQKIDGEWKIVSHMISQAQIKK